MQLCAVADLHIAGRAANRRQLALCNILGFLTAGHDVEVVPQQATGVVAVHDLQGQRQILVTRLCGFPFAGRNHRGVISGGQGGKISRFDGIGVKVHSEKGHECSPVDGLGVKGQRGMGMAETNACQFSGRVSGSE